VSQYFSYIQQKATYKMTPIAGQSEVVDNVKQIFYCFI